MKKKPKFPREPVVVYLKGEVPRTIERYRGGSMDLQRIYNAWKGQPVQLYGSVIPGYGDSPPYNQAHIPCQLVGHNAYTVVNLDEYEGDIDPDSLPRNPLPYTLPKSVKFSLKVERADSVAGDAWWVEWEGQTVGLVARASKGSPCVAVYLPNRDRQEKGIHIPVRFDSMDGTDLAHAVGAIIARVNA